MINAAGVFHDCYYLLTAPLSKILLMRKTQMKLFENSHMFLEEREDFI